MIKDTGKMGAAGRTVTPPPTLPAANIFSSSFGLSFTWTCPDDCSTVRVQLWGAGGAGGGLTSTTGGGGGGGGGGYAESNVSVSANSNYGVVSTGAVAGNNTSGAKGGNSTFGTNLVIAEGGSGGLAAGGRGIGGGANSVGTIKYSGGAGANSNTAANYSGPGGGGAGSTAAGNASANGIAGGIGGSANGGTGGGGRNTSGAGFQAGSSYGAGGGGARRTTSGSNAGGASSGGRAVLTWTTANGRPITTPYYSNMDGWTSNHANVSISGGRLTVTGVVPANTLMATYTTPKTMYPGANVGVEVSYANLGSGSNGIVIHCGNQASSQGNMSLTAVAYGANNSNAPGVIPLLAGLAPQTRITMYANPSVGVPVNFVISRCDLFFTT